MPLREKATWLGLVLDAPDALELGRFYQRLLAWQILDDQPDWVTPSACTSKSPDHSHGAYAVRRNVRR